MTESMGRWGYPGVYDPVSPTLLAGATGEDRRIDVAVAAGESAVTLSFSDILAADAEDQDQASSFAQVGSSDRLFVSQESDLEPSFLSATTDCRSRCYDIWEHCSLLSCAQSIFGCPSCNDELTSCLSGCGSVCNDADNDGVCNNEDNCPVNVNPWQGDCDNDGIGDACDTHNGSGCIIVGA